MSIEVMLDLETLSVQPDAAIISIGAVKFDPRGAPGLLGDPTNNDYAHFYANINLHSVVTEHGFTVDGATVQWWMSDKVSAEARGSLFTNAMDIDEALGAFWAWYGHESLPTWGNGAGFDNVILRRAFDKLHGACPFKFYHDRCFRTLKELYPDVVYVKPELAHNALSDAIAQAEHVQRIFNSAKL